jgi:hypothetical protein
MTTVLLIFSVAALCYLSYKAGIARDRDLLEDLKVENMNHKSQATLLEAKLKSTEELAFRLEIESRDWKAYKGMGWEYKGKPATSLAHIRYKENSYLLMEPASAGLAPFLIRADNPDLKPRVFGGKVPL